MLEQTRILKFPLPGGHGFAAEDANNLNDKLRGKIAEVIGMSNELNGPDRVVDGVFVQSKYYRSASETIAAAFDSSSGDFRYNGQVLEVPKDQWEDCVKFMRKWIEQGKVPGKKNPADAKKIVHQGSVTYQQAKNIARAGNIDSLIFDAKTQVVTSISVFPISFAVTFAHSRWRGESIKDATMAALGCAALSGSTMILTGVLSAQLLRTGIGAFGTTSVRNGVQSISRTPAGREIARRIATVSLGKSVAGAAAVNHVSRLLRTNAITAAVAAIGTSTPDFYRAAFKRSISWQQFGKNTAINAAGVITGTAGWIGGAAIGSVFPGPGTVIGGLLGGVGSLGAGIGGTTAAKFLADKFVKDDSERLIARLQAEIEQLASKYMLTEDELEYVITKIDQTINPKWLRRMFKQKDPSIFLRVEFEYLFKAIVRKRPKVSLPSVEQLERAIDEIRLEST
ncbi:hypothetical protein C6503_08695 [Candidatus Poribacteria bacterium]|nr:MAG: hypothetical protein C6503_08695 [Candidatus Poribacteria bacterium]